MDKDGITDSERVERILERLHGNAHAKAHALKFAKEPILDPAEFFEDMHELPSEVVQEIEEHAQRLEEAVQTGKLGR